MRVANKVCLVTGAANGLGAATARLLAREGAKDVVVADVQDGPGERVAKAIVDSGREASFVHLDVTDEEAWDLTVNSLMRKHGTVDVVVNNAGMSGSGYEDIFDREGWDRLVATNATGVFLGSKYAVRAMRASGGGSIVNVSSVSGVVATQEIHVGYNASKAAVRLLTKSIALQHGKDAIRVNAVHPGLMPPMTSSGRWVLDPSRREEAVARVPLGRPGGVEEVAYAVLFLASDEASYVTGAELIVDGGWTAS